MIEVFIVYSDDKQVEKVRGLGNNSLTFHFIDIYTKKGKKAGYALKGHWAARKDPFAIVFEGETPLKAFYSEQGNVIEDLLIYLKELEKDGKI